MSRDGLTGPATNVQYRRPSREERNESLEPIAFVPDLPPAIGNVVPRVSLVEVDDAASVWIHRFFLSIVNPSFSSTRTAPVFPPSKSPESSRWPVASSYAVPKMAFGG